MDPQHKLNELTVTVKLSYAELNTTAQSLRFTRDMKEKVDPYLRPIYDALYYVMPYDMVDKKISSGEIEIAPIAFMRGRSLVDCYIILVVALYTTKTLMILFLSTTMGC